MFGLMTRQAIRREAKTCALAASEQWESPFSIEYRRAHVDLVCTIKGISYPESKHGIFPEMLRTQAPEWWGRQIKKADRRAVETLELKAGRITRYCSDAILGARIQQKKDNRDLLAQMVAVCEMGNGETLERDLLDLVKGSNANPAVRRAELMTRISGFEAYAKKQGQVPYFFTMTCPSRFHRNSPKWNLNYQAGFTGPLPPFEPTPADANKYMGKVWAQARAKLARLGITPYGFRIAEPHKDGCPHWHCLFWFNNRGEAWQATEVIKNYFLKDSPNEAGAQRRRVTVEKIDGKKGSATGYIAKYICKNVDGIYEDEGQDVSFNDQRRNDAGHMENTGLTSDQAAARVDAWAACWGIRQFQQIGGPMVGPWRELRRLGADVQEGEIEAFRAAADAGQWDLFCELNDQHRAKYAAPLKVWAETSADKLEALNEATPGGIEAASDEAMKACLNQWQEPTLRTIKGVIYGRGLELKTRRMKWVLMLKKAEANKADQRRKSERAFVAAFVGKIEAGRAAAAAEFAGFDFDLWCSGSGASPPGRLDLCQ